MGQPGLWLWSGLQQQLESAVLPTTAADSTADTADTAILGNCEYGFISLVYKASVSWNPKNSDTIHNHCSKSQIFLSFTIFIMGISLIDFAHKRSSAEMCITAMDNYCIYTQLKLFFDIYNFCRTSNLFNLLMWGPTTSVFSNQQFQVQSQVLPLNQSFSTSKNTPSGLEK